ncbi:hypothetical protein AIOL_004075 [Candidatus Rhodobacter oscarellae]|uniref:Uncharacterized protein n=1 Tax=Candidatus Rhodobacter oscarellae TaxID=1675527 RepID=A0A0J9EBM1_9RHOB|nr:hypothetical protein [Candidatus Rhodobacter lobularis]KMW59094.1 hypothetical protein AIOL_004075 [Candidatus Rhodobacter lobularis]
MTETNLVKTRIHAGIWEGVLTSGLGTGEAPEIIVTHLEQPVVSVAVTADGDRPGTWNVKIAIPPDLLSDGVQTFVIWDAETEEKLTSFTIVTGAPLEDDIRGELDLLRAELDMLKKAFRRHCVETS